MQYTVSEINNGVAKITFSDQSWIYIELRSGMTEEELDDEVFRLAPPQLKTGSAPSFLSAGVTRTAVEKEWPDNIGPVPDGSPQWLQDRRLAYGSTESQIEYITENGLEAWQTHVAQIKADNPKTAE